MNLQNGIKMADAKTDSVWHLVSTFTFLRKKLSNDF